MYVRKEFQRKFLLIFQDDHFIPGQPDFPWSKYRIPHQAKTDPHIELLMSSYLKSFGNISKAKGWSGTVVATSDTSSNTLAVL